MAAHAWAAKLQVADVFHNDDMSLAEKAKTIQSRLLPIGNRVDPNSDELELILEELVEAAGTDSVSHFDLVWNEVYDWADAKRVWIETR